MTQRQWWTRVVALAVLGGVSLATNARAQAPASTEPDFPRGRISGYVFGDYYYNVTGDPRHRYNATTGSDSAKAYIDNSTSSQIGRDLNGVQIRRMYFQHDADLSIKYSTRVRLEADSKSLTSDGKLGVAVRVASLQIKNMLPRTNFLFGVLTTPIWENSEEYYGYRSVEKTIADFRGIGTSSDIGVQLKGFVDDAHKVGFSAMVGDGLGNKPEDNRYKKTYLSAPLRPIEDLRIEPYVDYEWVPSVVGGDKATYKLFAGYEMKKLSLGGELVDRVNHATVGRNAEPFGFSLFGKYKAHEKATPFARFDRWQPNTRAANRIDTDLYIAGVDWEPYKDVHIMPNIEATQYHARGTSVAPAHHDMQARITFYFKFAKP
jgi:hypothetical protein